MDTQHFKEGDFEGALKETFRVLDEEIKPIEEERIAQKCKDDGKDPTKLRQKDKDAYTPGNVGCTCCVVYFNEEKIYCAVAGDSRAVLSTGSEVKPLSEDHKPQNEEELERIENADMWVDTKERGMGTNRVNGELAVSRSIGDHKFKKNKFKTWDKQAVTACPDIRVFDRSPEDHFFINACDGIWDCKTNEEAVKMIQEEKEKQGEEFKVSECIIPMLDHNLKCEDQYGRIKGTDNMTCIVVFLKK